MRAHFLNVGCADCTVLEFESACVLVDCGYRQVKGVLRKPTDVLSFLTRKLKRHRVDLLRCTHPHRAHFVGLHDLLGSVHVEAVWSSPYRRTDGDDSLSQEDLDEYRQLVGWLAPEARRHSVVARGVHTAFPGATVTVLGPREDVNENPNCRCHDACVVVAVTAGPSVTVICGDASESELATVRNDWDMSVCTVLRASQHGSLGGAEPDFIEAASPRLTVVSTKAGVYEGIPDRSALARYKKHSKRVMRTDRKGTVTCTL
jgi:competence protein ComEC